MIPDGADIRNGWRSVREALGGGGPAPGKPGKYKILQKLYHLAVAILVLSIIASGLLMLLKIDTPLWRRNPYWFDSDTWGVIYSIHGFASMAMITLVMIHIYFALRPEEWWLTRSMFRGTVSRKEYVDHCDTSRWQPSRTGTDRAAAAAIEIAEPRGRRPWSRPYDLCRGHRCHRGNLRIHAGLCGAGPPARGRGRRARASATG